VSPIPPPPVPRSVTGVTVLSPGLALGLTLLSVGLLLAGCARIGPAVATAEAPWSSPVTSAPPTVSASSSIEVASQASSPTSTTPATEASPERPPIAWLEVDGGDPVEGQLGSFTWHDSGTDAPWLDGSPIRAGVGERFLLTVAGSVGIATWTASRVVPGDRDGHDAIGMGAGADEPISFGAPPSGTWSINVTIWFSDERGSAAYYWLANVK